MTSFPLNWEGKAWPPASRPQWQAGGVDVTHGAQDTCPRPPWPGTRGESRPSAAYSQHTALLLGRPVPGSTALGPAPAHFIMQTLRCQFLENGAPQPACRGPMQGWLTAAEAPGACKGGKRSGSRWGCSWRPVCRQGWRDPRRAWRPRGQQGHPKAPSLPEHPWARGGAVGRAVLRLKTSLQAARSLPDQLLALISP